MQRRTDTTERRPTAGFLPAVGLGLNMKKTKSKRIIEAVVAGLGALVKCFFWPGPLPQPK